MSHTVPGGAHGCKPPRHWSEILRELLRQNLLRREFARIVKDALAFFESPLLRSRIDTELAADLTRLASHPALDDEQSRAAIQAAADIEKRKS